MTSQGIDFDTSKFKVALVGAGNVATRIGLSLQEKGYDITGVYTRGRSAEILAAKLGCGVYVSPGDIPGDTDMVLIATTDGAVAEVAAKIPEVSGFVAHTSGSIPLDVISARHARAAVLYPLQTFSKDVDVDISKVPFFVEATDTYTSEAVKRVARTLSSNVREADSEVRSVLHVAGVMSSNFPMYLLEMTRRVLECADLPLATVEPLVKATVKKAFAVGPQDAMTGPARRGDVSVIRKQMMSIPEGLDRQIYEQISRAILQEFHPELSEKLYE